MVGCNTHQKEASGSSIQSNKKVKFKTTYSPSVLFLSMNILCVVCVCEREREN